MLRIVLVALASASAGAAIALSIVGLIIERQATTTALNAAALVLLVVGLAMSALVGALRRRADGGARTGGADDRGRRSGTD